MPKDRIGIIDLVFGSLFFILLFLSYLSYQRINNFIDVSGEITRTNLVRFKLTDLILNLINAESEQRGFVITRDTNFLKHYKDASVVIESDFKTLDSLIAKHPQQQKNLLILRHLVENRNRHLNKSLQLFSDSVYSYSRLRPSFETGRELMNEIKDHSEAMIKLDARIFREQSSAREHYASITPLLSLFLSVTVML